MYKGRGVFAAIVTVLFLGSLIAWAVLPSSAVDAEAFANRETKAAAAEVLELLRARDREALLERMGTVHNLDRKGFRQIVAHYPEQQPSEKRLLNVVNHYSNGKASYAQLDYELKVGDQWLLTRLRLSPPDGGSRLVGLHVLAFEAPYAERARMALWGQSPAHYLFLAILIVSPLLALAALWLWTVTEVPKRAWLWGVFILVGAPSLLLNWDTAAFDVKVLHAQLLAFGAESADGTGHLLLTTAVPIGAIVFLLRRREWRAQAEAVAVDRDAPEN